MRGSSVGVDVGGTFVKIGLVAPDGSVLRSVQIPTEPKNGPDRFIRRLKMIVAGWRYETIGFGLAGGVDAGKGTLVFVPNLRGWDGYSFKKAFKIRTSVENDANAAVWGGYVVALKKKPRTVVGVTLGTGVGGGLVIAGRLHRGATGSAGEVGHQTLELNGPRCHCGRRGCLEAYAGTAGIRRIARRLMREPPVPLTPMTLARAASGGDRGAKRAWDEIGSRLGQGLANMILVLNPDAVLILGGVARAGDLILRPLRRVFAAQSFQEPFKGLTLSAPADRDWGVVGAALLSREHGNE